MARSPLHRRGGEPQGPPGTSPSGPSCARRRPRRRSARHPRLRRQEVPMRVLLVHPSPLMFSEIYLRLEPLGLERVATAIAAAGHDVCLLDLQVFGVRHYRETLANWRPEAIGFSLNYLANVPEVVTLAREAKAVRPECRI